MLEFCSTTYHYKKEERQIETIETTGKQEGHNYTGTRDTSPPTVELGTAAANYTKVQSISMCVIIVASK